MSQIRLKLKPSNNPGVKEGFYGREELLNEAKDFLRDSSGGTILIGGVRGIGKTRFIEELRNETGWSRDTKYVFIDIAINDSIGPAELRSVLLRNICHSLDEVERKISARRLNGLSWFRVYLRNWAKGRIKSSEPRVRRRVYYKQLKKLSDYSKLQVISKKALGIGWSSSSTGLNNELVGEVDTSEIRIERILRKYLERVSELGCKVIFVFDELDKLDGEEANDNDQLSGVMVAKKFKNLLTTNNTFALFATTEQSYRFLKRKISRDPYCTEHTLFSRSFLLSQLSFDDFANIITTKLYRPETEKSQQIADYLAWLSAGHLFTLNEIVKQHQSADLMVFDEFEINYPSALHYYVRTAYEKHKIGTNGYYNHILYLSLRWVTLNLFEQRGGMAFMNGSYLPLLVSHVDTEIPEKIFELRENVRLREIVGMFNDDNWRQGLELLSWDEYKKINSALGDLIWLLDESNLLVFTPADQYVEVGFMGDALGYENALKVKFIGNKNTADERSILERSGVAKQLARNLGYSEEEYNASLSGVLQSSTLDSIISPGQYIHRTLSYERTRVREAIEQLMRDLNTNAATRFVEQVITKAGATGINGYYATSPLTRILQPYNVNSNHHIGGSRLWFCANVPEDIRGGASRYQGEKDIVINMVSPDNKVASNNTKDWYDVAFGEDYVNFRRKVRSISKKIQERSA